MNSQVTPDQVQDLLTLSMLILVLVAARLIGMAVWNRYFKDLPVEELTQEERDERLMRLARRR